MTSERVSRENAGRQQVRTYSRLEWVASPACPTTGVSSCWARPVRSMSPTRSHAWRVLVRTIRGRCTGALRYDRRLPEAQSKHNLVRREESKCRSTHVRVYMTDWLLVDQNVKIRVLSMFASPLHRKAYLRDRVWQVHWERGISILQAAEEMSAY